MSARLGNFAGGGEVLLRVAYFFGIHSAEHRDPLRGEALSAIAPIEERCIGEARLFMSVNRVGDRHKVGERVGLGVGSCRRT